MSGAVHEQVGGVNLSDLRLVRLDAHLSGPSLAFVDMIEVPRVRRGQGLGRAAYLAWEASLPRTVKLVRVWVADTDGNGRPFGFWEALGFDYDVRAEAETNLSYEVAGWMRKGVNGHPTPAPQPAEQPE
jgi:hypothetical protein